MECYEKESWQKETERRILDVIKGMGVDRMPSLSETKIFTGNTSLGNRIMKSGGFKHWASKLNVKIKNSTVKFGDKYESEICNKLKCYFDNVERTSVRFPYDIIVNGKTKIDVKASRLFKGHTGFFYTFNLESKYPRSDFYVVCCIADNDVIEKILVIPSFVMTGKVQLSIGKMSVYDKYIERWDLIEKHGKMMEGLVSF